MYSWLDVIPFLFVFIHTSVYGIGLLNAFHAYSFTFLRLMPHRAMPCTLYSACMPGTGTGQLSLS